MKKLVFLIFFLSGCYQQGTIPKSLFLEIKEVQKPKIMDLKDIQNAYIELFGAYECNLNLLKTLQKMQ